MISLRYAYLFSTLGFFLFYILIFAIRKDVRRKMLRLSFFGAIAGPVSQYWYLQDYWRPIYAFGQLKFLEDIIFGAAVLGIGGGIINILLRANSVDAAEYGDKKSRYLAAFAIILGSLLIFNGIMGLNSIYSSSIGFAVLSFLIWYERPDLIRPSLVGMIFWLFLCGAVYNAMLVFWPQFFREFWLWQNISGLTFLKIPIEEFLWFGSWGLLGSVVHEWRSGQRFDPR